MCWIVSSSSKAFSLLKRYTLNNKDCNGNPMQYMMKRGFASLTTIGCSSGFGSHVRRYFTLGSRDSVETTFQSYESDSGPFSMHGYSGSIIVDSCGKFVTLLTSGTGPTDCSDITYGSPMHWLWEIIETQFPGANLSFEGND